ncbi:hypothetical protein [Marinicrinis sediminis]|uniref:Carboxypeptidase regulatory-like domain-containing protein n=1 Tax=Marinicrinis sediminis TaxID=1652465 RepID=A0ABW5RF09_9BACL
MQTGRQSRFGQAAGIILPLVDGYTGRPPALRQLTVCLNGVSVKPLCKPDGHMLLMDVPAGTYSLEVSSLFYLPAEMHVQVETDGHPVYATPLILKPHSAYPFPSGAALIRGSLAKRFREGSAKTDDPSAPPLIRGAVQSESSAKARLSQVKAEKGTQLVKFTELLGNIIVGEPVLLKSRKKNAHEVIRIVKWMEEEEGYLLAEPLEHEYERGSLVYAVVETTENERGEFVLPFRGPLGRDCVIQVTVEQDQKVEYEREVRVTGQETVMLGRID